MSTEITRFNSDLESDTAMQDEVKALGNDLAKIVAYANEKGYKFTVEDVKSLQENGSLSDDELDEVAGGQVAFVAGVSAGAIALFN